MLFKKSFSPYMNILLFLKNIFSAIDYRGVFPPKQKKREEKIEKSAYSTMSFYDFRNKLCLVFLSVVINYLSLKPNPS